MQEFENTPEILALKEILREFFLGIIDNIKGAFAGFVEWLTGLEINPPPLLKFFGNDVVNGAIFIIFLGYIIFVNIKAYRLFAADKRYAEEGEQRIPERQLLANIWVGGALGSIIAIYGLRHKTKHKTFVVSAWLSMFIYLVIFSVVLGYLSFWTFL